MDFLDYMFEFNDDHETGILVRYTLMETKAHIPSTVAGYKITKIGRWAFCYSTEPFYEQAPLEEIEFEEGYREVFHGAFFGCDKLKRISFPSTIDEIYGNPFEGADSLEEIIFPNGNSRFCFKDGKLTDKDGNVYFERKVRN